MSYVVRHKNEIVNYPVEGCHGGEGYIYVRQMLGYEPALPVPGFPEDFETLVNFVHVTTLPEGTSIGLHPHNENEEFYLVIAGTGEMTVDGDKHIMKPGSICLTKSGSKHTFKNIGSEDLQIVVVEAVMNASLKNVADKG
ncbi:cupin domain-containing protein [Vallitalea sp.]|jgi:quercetin dioxygenase-like cupin family protein|uniref:cupin domain-containing protein n=1 Tax=Vallitalea sp. TaxID=1882829 RepID=UPI0025E453ED|nr:cupin domain-containing protein [Vallitalea sp.]MCT4687354.1 cupin domain-containing protein [Vallitalea sp.]